MIIIVNLYQYACVKSKNNAKLYLEILKHFLWQINNDELTLNDNEPNLTTFNITSLNQIKSNKDLYMY